MFCKNCGKEVKDGSKFCPYCGAELDGNTTATFYSEKTQYSATISGKSRGIAMILACLGFIAVSGIHRFYVNKIGTGILWLLTGGLFGIGTLIDVIMIATGSFKDNDGLPLVNWNLD